MINRKLLPKLQQQASAYPVVTLTGPRQSGKTTLIRMAFPEKQYFSLESPEIRNRALADPNAFLNPGKEGMILDEIQRTPELLSYIQGIVDKDNRPGMFILTGSAQFEMMAGVSQSLAGRSAIMKLLPLSFDEAYPQGIPLMEDVIYRGFYPRIFDQKLNPTEALSYYFSTYVERDVRSILNIQDIGRFETFVKLCSGRVGQLLNSASLGNDCGVSHNTIRNWFSVLETSYILFRLQPHHANFGKKLLKTPKLYFIDTGLACFLLDVENSAHLKSHYLRGSLFENMVIGEFYKMRLNANRRPNLYYWRDNTGNEIDLLLDFGTAVLPVEIKSGTTVNRDFFRGIDFYRTINKSCRKAVLVYGGDQSFREQDTWVLSYKDIGRLSELDHELTMN